MCRSLLALEWAIVVFLLLSDTLFCVFIACREILFAKQILMMQTVVALQFLNHLLPYLSQLVTAPRDLQLILLLH